MLQFKKNKIQYSTIFVSFCSLDIKLDLDLTQLEKSDKKYIHEIESQNLYVKLRNTGNEINHTKEFALTVRTQDKNKTDHETTELLYYDTIQKNIIHKTEELNRLHPYANLKDTNHRQFASRIKISVL